MPELFAAGGGEAFRPPGWFPHNIDFSAADGLDAGEAVLHLRDDLLVCGAAGEVRVMSISTRWRWGTPSMPAPGASRSAQWRRDR